MTIKLCFAGLCLKALLLTSVYAGENASQEQQKLLDIPVKIKDFLAKESKNLSKTSPFLLRLFKDGLKASTAAGTRISEDVKQFAALNKFPTEQLTGLLFYYQLYNEAQRVPHWHANAVEIGVVLNGKMKVTIWEGAGGAHEFGESK